MYDGKLVALCPNFLRVIGLSRPYHWHMRGYNQKMLNLYDLLRKAVISRLVPQKMGFEFMQPLLDPKGRGGDIDAVCITNPIDLKFYVRKAGAKVVKESAIPNHTNGAVRKFAELRIIRSASSFYFLVGIKMTSQEMKEAIMAKK